MLPTFLIIGAMKAGTTSLHRYLRDHPSVFMSAEKELHFFVEELNWRRGVAWYEEQFAGAGDAVGVGEASPSYTAATAYLGVPERIASVIPDVRLVYVVRHPVERMRSEWRHRRGIGEEQRPIAEALADDEPYLNLSRYGMQVAAYFEHFDPSQLLVVTAEALRHDREATVRAVLGHIGVDDGVLPASVGRELHRSDTKRVRTPLGALVERVPGRAALWRATPPRLRRWTSGRTSHPAVDEPGDLPAELVLELRRRLAPDVALLSELTGLDVSPWGLT